jgi:hypothetical protein
VTAALEELKLRIVEIDADFTFVALATQLRPRVGDAVAWGGAGEVLELVRRFMNAKSSRPEGVYGPLLIRLFATFERYLRNLVMHSVEQRGSRAHTFDELPETLSHRNLVLTGRILASLDSPSDRAAPDIDIMIANLATCKRGSNAFRLNTQAFSAAVTGASPAVIEKMMEYVDISRCWDAVGGNAALAEHLGTKGSRATGGRARERLKELWRWRNHLAHGGDEETAITESQLREAVNFVVSLCSALDGVVAKELRSA